MNSKNGFFTVLSVMLGLGFPLSGYAVVFPDQEVEVSDSENENADSISRFGSGNPAFKSRELPPIADSSFESSPERVGAGAPRSPGRSPAGTVKVMASDRTESPSVVVRKMAGKKAVQEASLIANDTGFYPSTLFLTRGIGARIFLTGASRKSQCFILDSFGIRRQVRNQKVEEVLFTPDRTGTFSFHCPMNGAKGTLVVKELELSSRTPASLVSERDFAPEFRRP
jgi:hypothetical protein